MSYFDGTEKRLEVVFEQSAKSLLSLSRSVFIDIVNKVGAKVLSVFENESSRAYLLSQSSLFVFSHRFILITCGDLKLDLALPRLGDFYPELTKTKSACLQERGFPELLADEEELAGQLSSILAGQIQLPRVFSNSKGWRRAVSASRSESFFDDTIISGAVGKDSLNEFYGLLPAILAECLPGYLIDQFKFDPAGYSMNALKGENYISAHVSISGSRSLLTLESNALSSEENRLLHENFAKALSAVSLRDHPEQAHSAHLSS